jgi:hypothetical protein
MKKDLNKLSNSIKIVALSLILLVSYCDLLAQKKYLPENKRYPSAKIYYDNNKVIGVRNVILINDSTLKFNYSGRMSSEMVSTQNVKFVTVKAGSHALAFGFIGAGIGVLSVALTQGRNASDPLFDDVNYGPFYLGFAAGGFLVGAIVGSASAKWETYYIPDKQLASGFRIAPSWSQGYPAMKLVYRF